MSLDLSSLLSPEFIRNEFLKTYEAINGWVMDPRIAFQTITVGGKTLAKVDLHAELFFYARMVARFPDLQVIRTEDVNSNLVLADRHCMFIDVIDGIHLFQHNLSNWCSAAVVFDQRIPRILGTYLMAPAVEKLYFSTYTDKGAFAMKVPGVGSRNMRPNSPLVLPNQDRGWIPLPVFVVPTARRLHSATVCMYSQKCRHLCDLIDMIGRYPKLAKWICETEALDREQRNKGRGEVAFRFYNLGGNPMLGRLCDGDVDVVLDLAGAHANDWVPGAYMALKAGAFVGTPDGRPFCEHDLAVVLQNTGHTRTPYIVSSSESLYREFCALLEPERP